MSSLRYENSVNLVKIVFISDINLIDESFVNFIYPIPLDIKNGRKLRKYLEMAINGYFLVAYDNQIIALGKKIKDKKVPIVEFNGYLQWKLLYSYLGILKYKDGIYQLPLENMNYVNSVKNSTIFHSKNQKEMILYCISEASKQLHGTTIIVSEEAKKEAARLCNLDRGIAIKCINLYKYSKHIKQITAIDGAIFIDLNCNCYGIGIILDGKAVINGTSSRGARYNSAKNYIAIKSNENKKYMAIILSEDKTIDIIDSTKNKL